jgi:hypothetical protein
MRNKGFWQRINVTVRKTVLVMLGVCLMATSASVLEGCSLKTQGDVEKIVSYLEEKYPGQTFVVNTYQGSGLPGTSSETKMHCSPVDNPDIVFVAAIAASGGEMRDTYPSEYINYQINELAEAKFAELGLPARTYFYVSRLNAVLSEGVLIKDTGSYFEQTGANYLFGAVFIDNNDIGNPDNFGQTIEAVYELLHEETSVTIGASIHVVDSTALAEAIGDMDRITTEYAASRHFNEDESRCAFFYNYEARNYSADEMNEMLRKGYCDERAIQ